MAAIAQSINGVSPQVFIGHSEPITEVLFSPDGDQVVSCGDAIFLWDFLGSTPRTSTPPHSPHKPLPRSVSPRRSAPAPVNYEPIKMHSFTPLAPASKHKPFTGTTLVCMLHVHNYVQDNV